MKITIEPTDTIRDVNGQPAREWRGTDDQGVEVVAMIRAVSPQTHDADVNARYERELKSLGYAQAVPIAFDIRHVI